jgi:hypothetical protein
VQVIDIKQFMTLFPWGESPHITATSSQFQQRIGAKGNPCRRWAKRLRLSVAWANPLKRFEISVSLCKPKDWVYLKVTGVNEVFQTGGHLTL